MSIGVSYDLFMESTPTELKPYKLAQHIKDNRMDNYMWILGQYVGLVLSGNYPKKPEFQYAVEDEYLTQEEIDNRELRRMLRDEEIFNRNFNKHKGGNTD